MGSHNGSIDTTHTPLPVSFYNTFKHTVFHICMWKTITERKCEAKSRSPIGHGKDGVVGHLGAGEVKGHDRQLRPALQVEHQAFHAVRDHY